MTFLWVFHKFHAAKGSKLTLCAECPSVEPSIVYRHLLWCSCLTVCRCGTSTQIFATLDFSWSGTSIFTQNEDTKSIILQMEADFCLFVFLLCRGQFHMRTFHIFLHTHTCVKACLSLENYPNACGPGLKLALMVRSIRIWKTDFKSSQAHLHHHKLPLLSRFQLWKSGNFHDPKFIIQCLLPCLWKLSESCAWHRLYPHCLVSVCNLRVVLTILCNIFLEMLSWFHITVYHVSMLSSAGIGRQCSNKNYWCVHLDLPNAVNLNASFGALKSNRISRRM